MIVIDRIHAVLDGNASDSERSFVESLLPLRLTDIERRDRFAPNYLVRSRAGDAVGHGWSHAPPTQPTDIALLIDGPAGHRIHAYAGRFVPASSEWLLVVGRVAAVSTVA
ncbi:hypothetical protein FHX10_006563 [Rhizobium sp. BK591]|uniref:hypothetical protein n=1 Tax=Rhizobium sp. BK591 TaxID=2586985 RepID=UPI00104B7445|nr:hypothetical protein [Rhizobium sp. BK591]MBB3747010.1 hypothetical protein [Rhizobium sp. BK591]